jgi:hypothetical protein
LMTAGGTQQTGINLSDSGTGYIENNTVIGVSGLAAAIGINSTGGTVIARNNIVYNIADDAGNFQFPYNGTFASGTDNNTTDSTDDIGTGSNNKISQTFTFTNTAGGDYSLASGDTGARDSGTTLATVSSGFTDDIIGTARDGSGAIDCGCFEFVSEVASITISYNISIYTGGNLSRNGIKTGCNL